jgi:SAM-dependent methyltransferase
MEACLYCGATTTQAILATGGARAVRCDSCWLVQTKPVPSFEYTNEDHYIERYEGMDLQYRRLANKLLTFVARFVSSGNLVEVGCGAGFFLEAAAQVGFYAEGVEINWSSIQECQRKGLSVHGCALHEAAIQRGSVDAVVMSHVLEHIENLKPFFDDVRRILRPGGWLFVSQPLHTGFMPWLIGPHWYGWGFGQHVWHFDAPSLTKLLRQEGLVRVAADTNAMHYHWLPQSASHRIHLLLPYLGAALLARAAATFGRGDQIFMAAQRQQEPGSTPLR